MLFSREGVQDGDRCDDSDRCIQDRVGRYVRF